MRCAELIKCIAHSEKTWRTSILIHTATSRYALKIHVFGSLRLDESDLSTGICILVLR